MAERTGAASTSCAASSGGPGDHPVALEPVPPGDLPTLSRLFDQDRQDQIHLIRSAEKKAGRDSAMRYISAIRGYQR